MSTPPLFSNFGKNSKDLFKKKFDFDQRYKSVRKTQHGITVEAGAIVADGNLRGYMKDTWDHKNFLLESEVSTDASVDSKASIKSKNLAKGLVMEGRVNTKSDDKDIKGRVFTDQITYERENFSSSLEVRSDLTTHKVKGTAAVGFDGFNLGGAVVLNVSKGVEVADYNVGLEFTRANHTLSLVADNKLDFLNLFYFQKTDATQTVGAQFKLELGGKRSHSLLIGHEIAIDASSTLKSKVEIPSGAVSVALDHRLANPKVSVNVAAQFTPMNFAKTVKADKFGFGLTVGDY